MKYFVFSFLFLFVACESVNVPEKIKRQFLKDFKNVSLVSWTKENDNEWEAEFVKNNISYSVNYLSNGDWKETEYFIDEKSLPSEILNKIKFTFSDYNISQAEILEKKSGDFYEILLKNGIKNIELVLTSDAQIVREEIFLNEN